MTTETQEQPETEFVGSPAVEVRENVRRSRELIPVSATGVSPTNFQQQVDYAQSMAKGRFSIPEHLQGNVGDCLAVIDIASRSGLSPYMLALQTYVEPKSKRLCFQSQAYHALAMPWLKGDLEIEYEGEGDDTVCIIKGYLKHEPTKMREQRSERLGDAMPERNEYGKIKGSPLWEKKPRVQLAYDTMRDWVRLHCPRATLGIYTPDEIEEYGVTTLKDVTPQTTGLRDRLGGAAGEGQRTAAHVESELEQVAAGAAGVVVDDAKVDPEPAETSKTKAKTKTKTAKEATGPKVGGDEAAKPADDQKPDGEAAEAPKQPTTAVEYIDYVRGWVGKAKTYDDAMARWDGEMDMRDQLQVSIADRNALAGEIEAKFKTED